MDTKSRDLENWILAMPVLIDKLATLTNNDFSSESKVPVEPSVPKTTSVCHDVELLKTAPIIKFAVWCDLEYW